MRVLVIGHGAEDARSPLWGHVSASLTRCGHEVWEYDPLAAMRTDRTHERLPALKWIFEEMRPDLVLAVEPPADVAAMLEAYPVPVRLLTAEELATHVHVEAFAPAEPSAPATEPEFDVVVAGDATLPAIRTLLAIRATGRTVHAWGDGWDGVQVLTGSVQGALPYPFLGDALRRGARVLAMGPDRDRQVLEANAAGRPAIHGATVDEVLAALEADPEPVSSTDSMNSWTALWRRELEPVQVVARDRNPRVSFFMPTYNNVAYLASCVESVLDQNVEDIELILQDDGSTDGTESLLERYASNPRIRIVRQLNIGQRDRFDLLHRRTGHLARGEFLAALGSDDLCAPDRLEAQLAVFDNNPEVDFVFGAARRIDEAGRDRGKIFELLASFTQDTLFRELATSNLLAHPTVLYRRDVYDRIGQMEEGFSSDYHLWLKAAGRLNFRYLPRHLVSYRVHENSSSMSSAGTKRAAVRGTECHDLEVFRRGLGDLYPELAECRGMTARAAAEVDLGNRMLWMFPGDALAAYERAASILKSTPPTLLHNLAVASLLTGDLPSAGLLVKRSDLPNNEAVTVAMASGQRTRDLLTSVFKAETFSPTFADAMRRTEANSIAWDGLPGGVRRLLTIPTTERPDLLGAFLRAWCQRTSPGDPQVLLIPTLTRSADEIAVDVLSAADQLGLDLGDAADISIEGIDGLDLLPSNYLSAAFVLETEADLGEAVAAIGVSAPSVGNAAVPGPRRPADDRSTVR
jgi:glycosyltransferase involved in cell wall biosynthesis